jgi:hypothetical protein
MPKPIRRKKLLLKSSGSKRRWQRKQLIKKPIPLQIPPKMNRRNEDKLNVLISIL